MTEPTNTSPTTQSNPEGDGGAKTVEAGALIEEARPLLTTEQTAEKAIEGERVTYSITAAEQAWIDLDADLYAALKKAREGGVSQEDIESSMCDFLPSASYKARSQARESAASANDYAQRRSLKAKAHCERVEAGMNLIAHLDEYQDAPLVIRQAGDIVAILVQSAKDLASDFEWSEANRIEAIFYGERIAEGDAK